LAPLEVVASGIHQEERTELTLFSHLLHPLVVEVVVVATLFFHLLPGVLVEVLPQRRQIMELRVLQAKETAGATLLFTQQPTLIVVVVVAQARLATMVSNPLVLVRAATARSLR
jgi:hypothetical protein